MTMSKEKLQKIRDKVNAALKEVGEELEVHLHVGDCRYSNNNATFKLQASAISSDGEVITKEAEDFKNYAFRYNMKPEDLGREFKCDKQIYKLVGAKPRSSKFPILGEAKDGTIYKFTVASVKFV